MDLRALSLYVHIFLMFVISSLNVIDVFYVLPGTLGVCRGMVSGELWCGAVLVRRVTVDLVGAVLNVLICRVRGPQGTSMNVEPHGQASCLKKLFSHIPYFYLQS